MFGKNETFGRTHVLLCCLMITPDVDQCNFMGDNKLLSGFLSSYVTGEIMRL